MAIINFPLLYIPNPDIGKPLFNGQIFVGEPDLDPEIEANQKQLRIVQEDGTKIDVGQPFTLGSGGVPTYSGNTVRLDVDGNYSLKILGPNGGQKYYVDNVFEGAPVTAETLIGLAVTVVNQPSGLLALDPALYVAGNTVFVTGWTGTEINGKHGNWEVVAGTGTDNEGTEKADATWNAAGKHWARVWDNIYYLSWNSIESGDDITSAIQAAQTALTAKGGGKIVINLDGWATIASLTTETLGYVDYAIDVESNIEITAIPEFELRADKSVGTDAGGYCIFRILENENIKIHGFNNINGIDSTTVKGIGQIVAIRSPDPVVTESKNIDIYDITYSGIRDEPFRLGQTAYAGIIAENVNIWNIRGGDSVSHAIVMRSIRNGNASGLQITGAGNLGIDISSYCDNCHLTNGRGSNRFLNTRGGAKVDGGTLTTNCSINDYYYDGSDGAGGTGNGDGDVNGYAFRLLGLNAKASNITADNCGGSGFNMSGDGTSVNDGLNMTLSDICIKTITNGDGTSSTFNGKNFVIAQDSTASFGVIMNNINISGAAQPGLLDANNVRGSLRLEDKGFTTLNDNAAGETTDLNFNISLKDAKVTITNDGTNGGSTGVYFVVEEFEGTAELDIEGSTNVQVTSNAPMRSTATRQVRFESCIDFHAHDMHGEGSSLVFVSGTTAAIGIIHGLTGTYTSGLIQEAGGTTVTKGVYADCINGGAGGYNIVSAVTQDNLL